jgi:hypothetical protein
MTRVPGFRLIAVVAIAGVGLPAYGQVGKDGKDRRVVVVNERSTDMMRLYASRVTTSDWEENILSRPIAAGSEVVVNFDDGTGACLFDFRAVFQDDAIVHMWSINVCRESYWRIVD